MRFCQRFGELALRADYDKGNNAEQSTMSYLHERLLAAMLPGNRGYYDNRRLLTRCFFPLPLGSHVTHLPTLPESLTAEPHQLLPVRVL